MIKPKLFLVKTINKQLETKPLFITDDQIFGVNYFNQWKVQHGLEDLLCQVEPIDYISSEIADKTDIQKSTLGETHGIETDPKISSPS